MKALIYIRTSTKEQTPELQLNPALDFAKNKGYEVPKEYIFIEKKSGFKKDVVRDEYNKALDLARSGKVQAVIVWALDRWVRDKETLLEDVTILKNYNVKLHSVQEAWLEAINFEGVIGRTISEFLLGLIGSIAQLESERKSERTLLAIVKDGGVTRSYKGAKWGRKELNQRVVSEILEMAKGGSSLRQIAQSVYYYDKNNNKKNVSLGFVHKIIHKKMG